MTLERRIETAFEIAADRYAQYGVDVEEALKKLASVQISIHCWQGDDVTGFEKQLSSPGGGLAVTGSRHGRARSIDELQEDLETAFSIIPGTHRLNLHAIYGDFSKSPADRDAIGRIQFQGWADWARSGGIGLDFNATCFAHPLASDGWTLCSKDRKKRKFWVEHVRRSREMAAWFGSTLGNPSVHNLWIPDGTKDHTVERGTRRALLRESLDEIYAEKHPRKQMTDSVESKLFGIGSESFVAGSHEFYMGWVADHNAKTGDEIMLCLDLGHFHPTESVADKLSSLLLFNRRIFLHISRGIRWDSDHVAIFDDCLAELMHEIVRLNAMDRVHLALDYFDASMNRVGAWVTGARSTQSALLCALLEPVKRLAEIEDRQDRCALLATLEAMKMMPFGAVWDYHCQQHGVPTGAEWLKVVSEYDRKVLSGRPTTSPL